MALQTRVQVGVQKKMQTSACGKNRILFVGRCRHLTPSQTFRRVRVLREIPKPAFRCGCERGRDCGGTFATEITRGHLVDTIRSHTFLATSLHTPNSASASGHTKLDDSGHFAVDASTAPLAWHDWLFRLHPKQLLPVTADWFAIFPPRQYYRLKTVSTAVRVTTFLNFKWPIGSLPIASAAG